MSLLLSFTFSSPYFVPFLECFPYYVVAKMVAFLPRKLVCKFGRNNDALVVTSGSVQKKIQQQCLLSITAVEKKDSPMKLQCSPKVIMGTLHFNSYERYFLIFCRTCRWHVRNYGSEKEPKHVTLCNACKINFDQVRLIESQSVQKTFRTSFVCD